MTEKEARWQIFKDQFFDFQVPILCKLLGHDFAGFHGGGTKEDYFVFKYCNRCGWICKFDGSPGEWY
jgi:hypothetical protein